MLPNHYFFGITADTQETPDSVEIFKFITQDTPTAAQIPAHNEQQQQLHHEEDEHWEYESDGMPQIHDTIASSIRDQQAQFADLHDRLQVITHAIDNLFKDLTRHGSRVTTRMEDLNAQLAKIQHITQLESRIGELENKIQQMRGEQKDWTGHFQQIENSLKTRHDALLAGLPESMGDGELESLGSSVNANDISPRQQRAKYEALLVSLDWLPARPRCRLRNLSEATRVSPKEIPLKGHYVHILFEASNVQYGVMDTDRRCTARTATIKHSSSRKRVNMTNRTFAAIICTPHCRML